MQWLYVLHSNFYSRRTYLLVAQVIYLYKNNYTGVSRRSGCARQTYVLADINFGTLVPSIVAALHK